MSKDNGESIISQIQKIPNFSFAKNSTYGCGGCAKEAYFPETYAQTAALYDALVGSNTAFITLGNCSDILASDSGFDGAVIITKKFNDIRLSESNTIVCGAGVSVAMLLKFCVQNGLSGLEYLAGIPATVGGLVYMNGGAAGKYICEDVVKVIHYDGNLNHFSNNQCKFGNKYSIMRDIKGIILGAELKITPKDAQTVRVNIAAVTERRRHLPKGKSCGCVFKNVDGKSAGKIIDEAGLKGLKIGTAQVSEEHANFIINTGKSSSDVYKLIKEVKQKVFLKTGIILEEEVVYIGDF